MKTKLFVRPAEGCVVSMPESGYTLLPESGARVPLTQYWLRRLACGDVVEVKNPSRVCSRKKSETPDASNPDGGEKKE